MIFVIETTEGEEWLPIGTIGLHRVDWKNRLGVLGIAIGEKRFWNRGLGTKAVRTLLRFAFLELNLHRVELEVYDFNPRAMRCYEKAGFSAWRAPAGRPYTATAATMIFTGWASCRRSFKRAFRPDLTNRARPDII
ncbi:MAG: GNAT family N-acetyltransferase [Anaerolineae bacterium]